MADEKKYVSDDNLLYIWQKIKTLLTGKVDKVDGKGLSTNDFTSTEKTKLANIASNAQVNVLEGIQVNGSTVTPTNKIANIDLSTYAKKSDITSVYKLKGNTTWASLIALTTAEVGDVYNVTDKGGANYVCIKAKTAGESSWDKLGDTVDLSGYYTSSQVDAKVKTVEDKIPTIPTNVSAFENDKNYGTLYMAETTDRVYLRGTLWRGLVEQVDEKLYSTLFNSYKNKPYFDTYQLAYKSDIPTALSGLTDDATHRLVTDTEKATWNAKSDFSGSYNDLTNKPTIPTIEELTNAEIDTIFES